MVFAPAYVADYEIRKTVFLCAINVRTEHFSSMTSRPWTIVASNDRIEWWNELNAKQNWISNLISSNEHAVAFAWLFVMHRFVWCHIVGMSANKLWTDHSFRTAPQTKRTEPPAVCRHTHEHTHSPIQAHTHAQWSEPFMPFVINCRVEDRSCRERSVRYPFRNKINFLKFKTNFQRHESHHISINFAFPFVHSVFSTLSKGVCKRTIRIVKIIKKIEQKSPNKNRVLHTVEHIVNAILHIQLRLHCWVRFRTHKHT